MGQPARFLPFILTREWAEAGRGESQVHLPEAPSAVYEERGVNVLGVKAEAYHGGQDPQGSQVEAPIRRDTGSGWRKHIRSHRTRDQE